MHLHVLKGNIGFTCFYIQFKIIYRPRDNIAGHYGLVFAKISFSTRYNHGRGIYHHIFWNNKSIFNCLT